VDQSIALRELGTPASRLTVRKLLKKHGLGQRKACKKKSLGAQPDRNAQFENIAQLKAHYLAAGDPVISIDTQKKALIGDFAREGHTHTQVPVATLDHDFPSVGQGKLIHMASMTWHEMKALCISIAEKSWKRSDSEV